MAKIITLPVGQKGSDFFLHAVGVCDADGDGLTIMDPQVGDFTRVPWSDLQSAVERNEVNAFLIGGLLTP